VLYAGFRYGWDPRQVGLTLTVVGVCTAVVQGGLVGPAVRWLGERRAVLIGLLAGAVAYAMYGLAPTGNWFLAAIPFGALGGLYSAAAQALMTQRVSHGEQGQLQGVNSSLIGLTGIVGPLIFGLSFERGLTPGADGGASFPGAPFVLAALLSLAAVAIALKAARPALARP
jgi:DHA1 family tetracycline resistance protein-like MFS transporter